MFGLHGKLTAQPGQGDALEAILLEAAAALGENDACRLYVVHRSDEEPEAVWVTEVWVDEAAHRASLQDPATREAIAQARPIIAAISDQTRLTTVGGKGV
jgi:quinol monooxygenase YgiN